MMVAVSLCVAGCAVGAAEGDLASEKITESEFNEIDKNAKLNWLGE